MARINFESEIRADARFKALVRKLRNEREAIGLMIDLWEVAQKYWGRDRSLIPKKVFTLGDFGAAVEVGFAEEQDDGFYVSGAGEHFEWLASKRDSASAGGRASAAARKKKYGSAVPVNASNEDKNRFETEVKPNETEVNCKKRRSTSEAPAEAPAEAQPKRRSEKTEAETEANPNALTLTLTPTLTLKNTNTNTEEVNPEADACGGPTATDLKTSRPAKEKPSEFDFEIADAWHSHALTVTPNKKCNRDREADAVRMLRSVDGYPEADIRALLAFVKRDSFWSNNALSPCGLRITKPGGVRKIENIVAAMKRRPSGPASFSKANQDEQKRTVFDVLDEVGA